MPGMTTNPFCAGITAPALTSFAATNIAGHAMVGIPGGLTVIGSSAFENARPRWVSLSPHFISETATSESQYREVMGRAGNAYASADHPVTAVSWNDAQVYLKRAGGRLDLLTEVQWENAARGPADDMRIVMEKETGRFTPTDFVDFAVGRYENFVFGVLGQIFTDARSELFQKLISEGMPFFGWRVYGTPSGKLTKDEAWYDQEGTAPVNWGPKNAYGLHCMTGNVWELMKDAYEKNPAHAVDPFVSKGSTKILRGGSRRGNVPGCLQAGYRVSGNSGGRGDDVGFRVAAPQDSRK